jgi:large subunit ribosomal protein L4
MATVLTLDAAKSAHLTVLDQPKKASQAVHDTVTAMRANRRSGTANTKTRSELKKPDKKPWRQKGTGRARAGTPNSPLWCGGAVIFGPKPRSYAKKVNVKVKKLALRAVISSRIQAGEVLTVPEFSVADGKTKSFLKLLSTLTEASKVLIIAAQFDEVTLRAARNHGHAQLATAKDVNVEQLANYRQIIITSDALPVIAQRTAA